MIFELLMCLFVTHDLLAAHDCVGLLIVFLFNRLLVTFVFLMTLFSLLMIFSYLLKGYL